MLAALLLLLSAPLLAQTPGLTLEATTLFPDAAAQGTPVRLEQQADLLILDDVDFGSTLVRVRTADQQEGFVPRGQLGRLAAEVSGRRFYLTGHRADGEVLLVMTDLDGTVLGVHAAPGEGGVRLHVIRDAVWPGVDALLVVEAFRESCPGGTVRSVIAQVGDILSPVSTASSHGEEGWFNKTIVYRPVRDADGVLRYRSLVEDALLARPVVRPQPGVLVIEQTVHEPWSDSQGRSYTLDSSTQQVLRWFITPETVAP